jgi:hypothetical protein
MADNAVLYSAIYSDLDGAKADLDAFEQLRKESVIGSYDAAIIDQEDGKPHVVKRADHPGYRVIPEWFGSGTLPRGELHEAARALNQGEAALIVVGEPTLEKGFEKAVTRANKTFKQDMNAASDELERELLDTAKK